MMYVRVALPVPRLEPLTYVVDDADAIACGYRVIVPLGKRTLTGTVVGLHAEPVDGVRKVEEILDTRPSFSDKLLEVTRRVSEYYLCSWGEVLQAAIPGGLMPTTVVRIHVERPLSSIEFQEMQQIAPKRAKLLRILADAQGDLTLSHLQKKSGSTSVQDQLDALIRDGWITVLSGRTREVRPKFVRGVRVLEALRLDSQSIKTALDELDVRAPKQSLALAYLLLNSQSEGIPVASICEATGVSTAIVDALVRKGLAELVHLEKAISHAKSTLAVRDERAMMLTDEQQRVLIALKAACDAEAYSSHLLHGVTGSGKTIVYQRVIDHVLGKGQTAIVLVPEIALTPQLGDRFTSVFGDMVGILHSRISMSDRITLWNRISEGKVRVVIGPRSAVLTNVPNVGVIIVDEEHEPSYKQDEPAPRYHGRDVALMRAYAEGCPVILGSATPSLEAWNQVASGRSTLHTMRNRADGATFPDVRIVDMRAARKQRLTDGMFAHETLRALADCIGKKEGALVFLNRRGYSSNVQCNDCGDVPRCEHCDVALTYHKYPSHLRCHYCGLKRPYEAFCHTCGSTDVHEIGSGTQRIEEDLANMLQQHVGIHARIARMDADSTARKGQHRDLLERFSSGELDILVGTQMIAKGLDIDRCTLVVVVNADQSLYHGEFRASERTMQLLVQVGGRAGRRSETPGRVMIQTSSPEHPAIQVAVKGEHDLEGLRQWYANESLLRLESSYPPFSRFIVVEISSFDEALAHEHAGILHALLPKDVAGMRVYPVQPPSIAYIRNWHRRIIVVKNDKAMDASGQLARSYLRTMLGTYYQSHSHASVRVHVDIDARGLW